ncbi:drug/metabolite transporter (DMT)-like permease [Alkalibacillus filiformis]|uniref:Drug/metabolite transporter (DMT)-like permease n=1 Tax=Alkalibacillus filiformis TaxID=200990 RepID=A0ABU0DU47_9BACI|nr:EamA family transporter [Alkalibacillus filiformis]MDQ0351975.1 drug/metabolite transporter (DMT)-like permease [Alkalibacillus filiformis]
MVRSYVFLTITVIIFSGNLLVGKAINDLPPITITFFRCLIALLIVIPFAWKQLKWQNHVLFENWKPLFGFALTGIVTFNVLVYLALNYTSAINAGIVEASTPMFAIILGFFILKERLSKRQLFGIVLSFVGAVWVLSNGSINTLLSLQFNPGDLIMLLAILVWAVYSLLVKQHNHKFPIYSSIVAMLSIGIVLLLPLMLVEWYFVGYPFVQTDINLWLGLIYLGVFPSFIALMLWNLAVADIGPSLASVFLNLLPVFTTIGAVLFLNETLLLAHVLGGLLVIVGVLLVNLNLNNIKYFRKHKAW